MPGGAAEDVPVCLILFGTASVTAIEKKKNRQRFWCGSCVVFCNDSLSCNFGPQIKYCTHLVLGFCVCVGWGVWLCGFFFVFFGGVFCVFVFLVEIGFCYLFAVDFFFSNIFHRTIITESELFR